MSTLDDIEHDKLSRLSAIREHFKQNVSQSWSDIVLIICTFIAGLVDSAVFNVWDCFVSMQTGMNAPFKLPFMISDISSR